MAVISKNNIIDIASVKEKDMHAIYVCLFLYGRIIRDCVQINRKIKTSQKHLPHL